MKNKNQRIWSTDLEFLKRLADEQENYIGRQYKLDLKQGLLIIYALPQKRHKKKDKQERNKQRERFERK